ncbi:hypothetical protein M406DRAFT_284568 [Cryphonectria parasitica EP155]|uniref:Prolyl 4-hydroxylase alpha subunit domain-containing protein n=1 Tax=Cryphonectria parasitica (strain ATCC 38755 / EP155) TaxID=660469 RepID=A0A9P5CU23_CRYP1|nr:uncharacterized protein M406DRAFT_284568 [Cryphonectria parasitica EP155]KAF3770046.1 hypothetical protein M406DRAFT_284568 [Cryphonectria parasitica EP155]
MLSYIVGLLACLLVFYNPLSQLLNLSPSAPPQIRRTPRPRVDESLLALDDWRGNLSCPDDADSYRVHVFSKAPLVIYIESFLSRAERAHLLEISEPAFEPATITHDGGAATERDQTIRDSEVAVIPRTEVVRCIEARARAFQGWRGEQWIERLRTQRYRPGGHYNHHFDWSSSYGGWGRVSSFMVWVDGSSDDPEDTLQGGGTEFPLLRKAGLDERWCRFIECGTTTTRAKKGEEAAEAEDKVVFKPLAGNAVYWENFKPDGTGRGWDEAWHAGLPVIRGTKVGLNIWTWGRID